MWKKIVGGGRPQMTIWCMHIACWIPKATNTLTVCNTYCFSTATMVARSPLIVVLYVHRLSYEYYIVKNLLQQSSGNKVSYLRTVNANLYSSYIILWITGEMTPKDYQISLLSTLFWGFIKTVSYVPPLLQHKTSSQNRSMVCGKLNAVFSKKACLDIYCCQAGGFESWANSWKTSYFLSES